MPFDFHTSTNHAGRSRGSFHANRLYDASTSFLALDLRNIIDASAKSFGLIVVVLAITDIGLQSLLPPSKGFSTTSKPSWSSFDT